MPIWNPSLAIGVPAIDAQHQELFRRTDALLAAMRGGSSADEIGRLLSFLESYCEEHFGAEAGLMARLRYPDTTSHLEQHAAFRRQFAAIVETFRLKGPTATVTISVQQLLSGWLVHHIKTVDARLAAFMGPARDAG